jgi:F-type H+-transporting ATPase subunit c
MNRLWMIALVAGVLGSLAMPLFAAENAETQQNLDEPAGAVSPARALGIAGACIGAGVAAVGGGFGIARVGGNCIEAIARQPEAAGSMFAPMIVTAAMIEGAVLFSMVVCLLGVLGI